MSRHACDDITGATSFAIGHVLGRSNYPDNIDIKIQRRDSLHHSKNSRSATHVVFHFVHAIRRFNGNSACIECHTFADEHDRFSGLLATLILHDHQSPRLFASSGDRKKSFHTKCCHVIFIECAAADLVKFCVKLQCNRFEIKRCADVRRKVAEVAGQGHALRGGNSI